MEQSYTQVRKLTEARLLMRALEDVAFRELLLKDPRKAFQEELGVAVPDFVKLQTIEEPADAVILVVPAKPAAAGELSNAQLENVSGGLSHSRDILNAINRLFGWNL